VSFVSRVNSQPNYSGLMGLCNPDLRDPWPDGITVRKSLWPLFHPQVHGTAPLPECFDGWQGTLSQRRY